MRAAAIALTPPAAAAAAGEQKAAAVAPKSRFHGTEPNPPWHPRDFALRDQDGRLIRLSAQRGRYVLLAFLYTSCPDVCPLIAANLNQALRDLGPERPSLRVLAISVDPRGNTPARVRAYARTHRLLPQFPYLIGSRSELMPDWEAYYVLALARNPELVDHSAYTLLIDRQGRARVRYDAHVTARDILHDLRLLRSREQ